MIFPVRNFCAEILSQHVIRSVFYGKLNYFHTSPLHRIQIVLRTEKKMSTGGWFELGRYSVFPWSISGIETSVVVKSDDIHVTFDMGYSCKESITSKFVFISHGHMDHVSGVPQHATKKSLCGMKPAKYFVPQDLIENLKSVCQIYSKMAGNMPDLEKVNLMPAPIGEQINISSKFFVKPFATTHRVPSQGYILYRRERSLKEEYRGRPSDEISRLVKDGVQVNNQKDIPDVAYTGDTTFELFQNSPPEDIFKVKILITEATYIDLEPGKDVAQKARDRGHMHLQEIVDNATLFENVEKIVLIHFSDKYSPKYIVDTVNKMLPESLRDKVVIATTAKERYG